jgi:hypothetical protein
MRTGNIVSAAAMTAVFCVVANGCGGSSSAKTSEPSVVPDAGAESAAATPTDSGSAPEAAATDEASAPADATAPDDATAPADAAAPSDTGAPMEAAVVCAPPLGGDDCDTCLSANCCAQLTACDNEPLDVDGSSTECQDLVNCVDNCTSGDDAGTTQSCSASCTQAYGPDQGVTDYENLAMCEETTCGAVCN